MSTRVVRLQEGSAGSLPTRESRGRRHVSDVSGIVGIFARQGVRLILSGRSAFDGDSTDGHLSMDTAPREVAAHDLDQRAC
jgi:hypothetical protein